MSVPSSYAPHATASYTSPNRDRVYTWTLFGPSGTAPGPVPVFRLAGPPRVAFGEASAPEFGGGLIAHSADYTFREGAGVLDDLLDDAEAGEYLCRITGPDGHGGTYTVWTRPMQGETQGTASPLVLSAGAAASTGVGSHDGLAALEDNRGGLTTGAPLSDIVAGLLMALPGGPDGLGRAGAGFFEIHAAFPISAPDDAADALLSRLRPAREIVPTEEADGGTVLQQLRVLAEAGTLSVYQPTDADPEEPRWEVATRSRVGTPLACSVLTSTGSAISAASGTMPDRTETMPAYEADASGTGARRVRRASSIRFDGKVPITYPTPVADLGDGEEQAVPIGRFSPTPGLGFFVADRRADFTDGASAVRLGSYRLELAGDDATTYTFAVTPDEVTVPLMPVAGALSLVLVGQTQDLDTDNNPGTPDSTERALFLASSPAAPGVLLQDAEGASITAFVLALNATGGKEVAVSLLSPLEAWDGAGWVPVTNYAGLVSGEEHGSIAAAQAAERAAQQGADLRALVVTVRGLYGPQARFTLAGSASGNPRSPFPEDVVLVPIAGEPDLETGYTSLVLVSVAEADGASA
ncbi:MAG: hypothetical protein CMM84_16100 [Rhodothermaceae bacterium]|nr:hypothetical protein [Rhodothermaceae bacterium]MBC12533.1 hypothetical protein [Rhodothermaceae bacterium]